MVKKWRWLGLGTLVDVICKRKDAPEGGKGKARCLLSTVKWFSLQKVERWQELPY